jgi:hypothetical protein
MTWAEIKRAVAQAGAGDNDEIGFIECANSDGDRSFHKLRSGRQEKLAKTF